MLKSGIQYWKVSLCFVLCLFVSGNTFALTAGDEYTVSIEKVNSDGTVTSGGSSLGLSNTYTADADGKIGFSFNGIPTNGTCNFMVVTLTNAVNVVERKSVVPCPTTGSTMPLGVSTLTASQADALLAGFLAAGSDGPILAVFGLTIVRTTGMTAAELAEMATIANGGINNTGGYVDYLLTTRGVTTAQMATYRSNIISLLADPDSGYSKSMKDSVDVADSGDSTLEAAKRGEAAAKLLGVLVEAATAAGFSQDWVLEAFNAMGAVAVPLMQASTELTAASKQSMNSSVGGGIQKLKADKDVEKYTQALSTLGATGADLTTFTDAATALSTAMIAAFSEFDKVFTGTETSGEISTADTTLNTAMQTAFTTFITSTAASNARLTTMIANIDAALNSATGLTTSEFQFFDKNGASTNWPISMVIPTDWISTVVSNGGGLSYTRDNTAIPTAFEPWLGSCSTGDPTHNTKALCDAEPGPPTWTPARTNFVGQGIPASYAAMFGIQEDIMILEFKRWDDQTAAAGDMSQESTLEQNFTNAIAGLATNLGGTTDGTTSISTAQKEALVTLMKSPQF